MDQKTQFIADYLRKVLSVTELCDLYGVSRVSNLLPMSPDYTVTYVSRPDPHEL
ncbi:MAG: hypothetical protein V4637_08130 [Pseudomonadota bacterium]